MVTTMILCASMWVMADAPAADQPQAQSEQKTELKADAQQQPQADKDAVASDPKPAVAAEFEEKEVDGVKLVPIEANVVSYTNQERARYGLPPLQVDETLMATAREHAAWMTRTRNMVHTSRPVAENIAMGQPHSSDVVRSWMNSSGHRANILNSGYRRIGVAAYRTESGTIFWCQQFRQ